MRARDCDWVVCCSVVQKWPNTYTLTKAIAETLLLDYKDLPIAIVRPSIRKLKCKLQREWHLGFSFR